MKLILDTRVGDNVDEAFLLALACNSPELEILGITTTYSPQEPGYWLTKQIMSVFGRSDVPVVGYSKKQETTPSYGSHLYPNWFCHVALDSTFREPGPNHSNPVEFMAKIIDNHPDLVVIATAPLTNIAELIHRHPFVTRKIKKIVFMGGWSNQSLPEHNIGANPKAASVVLATDIPLESIGLESTLPCILQRRHLERLQASSKPGPRLLTALMQGWLDSGGGRPVMHDPLTIMPSLVPNVAEYSLMDLELNNRPGPGYGTLHRSSTRGRRIRVCTKVDVGLYVDRLIERITSPSITLPTNGRSYDDMWLVTPAEAHFLKYYPGWSLAKRTSTSHIIVIPYTKQGCMTIDGISHDCSPESIVYCPEGTDFSMSTTDGLEAFWLAFHLAEQGEQRSIKPISAIPWLPTQLRVGKYSTHLTYLAKEMVEHQRRFGHEKSLLSQARLLELFSFLRHIVDDQVLDRLDDRRAALAKAKRYIEQNCSAQLCHLDKLSEEVGLSKSYLVRAFRDEYGITPGNFSNRLVLNKAKILLGYAHYTVNDVALELGYSSVSAFSRAFSREFGLSPSDYRNKKME